MHSTAGDSERQAIADEARDLLAHDLALVGVQLRAARLLMHGSPDATAALAAAETTCTAALWRLRRLSRLLAEEAPARYAPQPAALDLDALDERTHAVGATLEWTGEEHLHALPGDVALSVGRIVELLLTPGAHLRLKGHPMGVRITARDAPRDAAATARIAERVSLLAGTARWSPERVTIDLPAPHDATFDRTRKSYAAARDQGPRRR